MATADLYRFVANHKNPATLRALAILKYPGCAFRITVSSDAPAAPYKLYIGPRVW